MPIEQLGADTNRPRINKTLSKALRSHTGWRAFTTPALSRLVKCSPDCRGVTVLAE